MNQRGSADFAAEANVACGRPIARNQKSGGVCYMNYIRITRDNINKEHICCAMFGK